MRGNSNWPRGTDLARTRTTPRMLAPECSSSSWRNNELLRETISACGIAIVAIFQARRLYIVITQLHSTHPRLRHSTHPRLHRHSTHPFIVPPGDFELERAPFKHLWKAPLVRNVSYEMLARSSKWKVDSSTSPRLALGRTDKDQGH